MGVFPIRLLGSEERTQVASRSSKMPSKYVSGCFESVIKEDAAAFYEKLGMAPELAKQVVGKRTKIMSKMVNDKTLLVSNEFEGMPEWDITLMLHEGCEVSYNMPGLGLMKGCIKICGDECIEYTEKTATMGTLVNMMNFCEKGVEYVTKSVEHGCQYTHFWDRVVDADGMYRLVGKVENPDGFESVLGINIVTGLEDPSFKYHVTETPDGFISRDYFDGQWIVSKEKWGVECVDSFNKDVTDLHVKTGPGSYKTISKHKDGRIQEATTTTCMDRTTMVIKDMQTGKTLKATFEKFTDFSGEYKIISESGLKEFAQAVGANVEECMGFFNGPKTVYFAKEMGCYCEIGIKVDGKAVHSAGGTYGDEFSTVYPHVGKDPFQVVMTKNGNTISMVSKGKACTIKTTMKRTKSFLIMTDEICGTNIKLTYICVPIC